MLTGERVVLRPVTPDDYRTMYGWRIEVGTWAQMTARPLAPLTYDAFVEFYEKQLGKETNAEFAVDVDGALVGRASLFEFDDLARNAELGISFGPEHRGKGYGRDAIRVLLDYGFRHRNLHRVWLEALATNEPALRAYAAAGFVEEGRLRDHAWAGGTFVDMVRMAVLYDDWKQ
jgi:RimJ/RimL family protein N-acetyltransferase